jgi:polyisoprenyl-phosphate glycosyltransferase
LRAAENVVPRQSRREDNVQSKVSIIVPVYNEAGAIEPFVIAVEAVATTLDVELDILFVDDGSRDATCDEIAAAAETHAIPIQLLALSRNFGKEAALTAGLDAAAGDAVIPIDVDLQHPPEIIPLFIEEWRRGSKVVYGRRIEGAGSRGSGERCRACSIASSTPWRSRTFRPMLATSASWIVPSWPLCRTTASGLGL